MGGLFTADKPGKNLATKNAAQTGVLTQKWSKKTFFCVSNKFSKKDWTQGSDRGLAEGWSKGDLPGLNLTHNQLFFLSFAQVASIEKITHEYIRYRKKCSE